MVRIPSLAAIVVLALLPAPAFAQMQELSGQWSCQYGYAEYTAQGYLRGHSREFNAALYPNGGFEASGYTSSGAGVEGFQAQGQWLYHPQTNEIEAQGSGIQQSGMQMPFAFGGVVAPGGRGFQTNVEMPGSTGRYVAQRLTVLCQR